LPRPRRPAPARRGAVRRRRHKSPGRVVHRGRRRADVAGAGRPAAGHAGVAAVGSAFPLSRARRGERAGRMAGPVGVARRAAAAGLGRDRGRGWPSLATPGRGSAAGGGGRRRRAVPMRRERGIALLLVMWLTMLLAAVVGTFALTAQMEKLQGRTL